MKEPAPRPRHTRLIRRSTRRSGYAFSHAQGYGDLVTSRRFLRRPALVSSMGFTPAGRSPGFKPTGRSAGYSPVGREQNPKQKVEPTSLQMFRAVKDSSFWGCSFSFRARTKILNAVYKVWTLQLLFYVDMYCTVYTHTLRTMIPKCTKFCLHRHTCHSKCMCGLQQEQTKKKTHHAEGQRVLGLSNVITTMGMTCILDCKRTENNESTLMSHRKSKRSDLDCSIQNTVSCSFPLPGTVHYCLLT